MKLLIAKTVLSAFLVLGSMAALAGQVCCSTATKPCCAEHMPCCD